MTSETGKKGMAWFKGVMASQTEKGNEEEQEIVTEFIIEEPANPLKEAEQQNTADLFSKDKQDKIALDVIISIENILKERQLIAYKNKALEDQLYTGNETINRFKQEQIKREQLLQEKSKEIRELENNLTNKQMSYDQLLEDYKEYQLKANMEYEKILNQLETNTIMYTKLKEESTNIQYQSMLKQNELEDKIRSLAIENENYAEKYQEIVNEKKILMQTITDFTERMSFSFAPKVPASKLLELE